MKKLSLYIVFLMSILFMFISGCLQKRIDPITLTSPDEKALYDLMVEKCRAINTRDMNLFRQIYTKDSPELDWIENKGIPMWKRINAKFKVTSIKKISIVGNDAAACFVLRYHKTGYTWFKDVEALYVKEGNQWKIEATGE